MLRLQLNSEKLELEKRESEQEGIVSKLQKKVTLFCGVPACCAWSCRLCTAMVCLRCAAQWQCCLGMFSAQCDVTRWPHCSAACVLCTLETVTDLLVVHMVQLVELSMEKHKLNLEKVQLENQLEAEQEYIVHKLQKQVGSRCICRLAAQRNFRRALNMA